jgi:DNA polymerase-3 subunit delta
VVVVREAGRLLTADVPRLVEVVKDPLPSTVLILVGGGGTVPAPLVKAITAAGKVIDVSVNRPGDRKAWLHDHLRHAPGQARAAGGPVAGPARRGGPGPGRGLLGALAAAYGPGARITVDDLEPYLGEAGNVARYELTDAIDRGDAAAALGVLHRMTDAGGLSAVEVLFSLHRHYSNMLTFDGATVSSGEEAAQLLSVSSAFVGKKALEQSRRLGSARIAHAIELAGRRRSRREGCLRPAARARGRDPGGPAEPADPPAKQPCTAGPSCSMWRTRPTANSAKPSWTTTYRDKGLRSSRGSTRRIPLGRGSPPTRCSPSNWSPEPIGRLSRLAG